MKISYSCLIVAVVIGLGTVTATPADNVKAVEADAADAAKLADYENNAKLAGLVREAAVSLDETSGSRGSADDPSLCKDPVKFTFPKGGGGVIRFQHQHRHHPQSMSGVVTSFAVRARTYAPTRTQANSDGSKWERYPLIAVYANSNAKNALVLVHISPVEVFINGRKLNGTHWSRFLPWGMYRETDLVVMVNRVGEKNRIRTFINPKKEGGSVDAVGLEDFLATYAKGDLGAEKSDVGTVSSYMQILIGSERNNQIIDWNPYEGTVTGLEFWLNADQLTIEDILDNTGNFDSHKLIDSPPTWRWRVEGEVDVSVGCHLPKTTTTTTTTTTPTTVVRLIGSSSSSGRLEIFHNGQWGTVCAPWPYWFKDSSATVVCRMLGFENGTAHYKAAFGQGNGPIWLSYPNCRGNELSIFDCPINQGYPIGSPFSECNHGHDVGVSCPVVRLIGPSSSTGRLEIFHNGQWGTVCAPWPSWFNKSSATVVCRMLGFSSGTIYGLIYGEFTLDNGPIWLSYPHCKGNELSIFDCPMHHDMPIGSPWSGCNHRYDVGVSCQAMECADPLIAAEYCHNGGTCFEMSGNGRGYGCHCTAEWTGERCEVGYLPCELRENCTTDKNECDKSPCKNGGTCTNYDGDYSCKCQDGWTGNNCDQEKCTGDKCTGYRGTKAKTKSGHTCLPWSTVGLPELDENYCRNPHGMLDDIWCYFKKEPRKQWEYCSLGSGCQSNTCVHGTCGINTCKCDLGYIGEYCNKDKCQEHNPCFHGNCSVVQGVQTCKCEPGYGGDHCAEDIDECQSNPCGNPAQSICTDGVNSYTCKCREGYRGKYCKYEINLCDTLPKRKWNSDYGCYIVRGTCVKGIFPFGGKCQKKCWKKCTSGTSGCGQHKWCNIDNSKCTPNQYKNAACEKKWWINKYNSNQFDERVACPQRWNYYYCDDRAGQSYGCSSALKCWRSCRGGKHGESGCKDVDDSLDGWCYAKANANNNSKFCSKDTSCKKAIQYSCKDL